jgi:hypothetical protein
MITNCLSDQPRHGENDPTYVWAALLTSNYRLQPQGPEPAEGPFLQPQAGLKGREKSIQFFFHNWHLFSQFMDCIS